MKDLSATRSAVPAMPHGPVAVGEDVLDLTGEYSQYTVPRPVAEAVVHAAQTTDLGRTSVAGGRPLRDAILVKLQEFNALEATAESVVITGGGTAAMSCSVAALTDPGDGLLVPDPGWPGYGRMAMAWGVEPIGYPLLPDGRPDYDVLEGLCAHRVKALVVCSPSNPAGAVLTSAALVELIEFAQAHDLYLLSDETCDLIRFHPGPAIGPARFDTDGRVISCFSFAKTHALAGLRLGYAVAAPPLARAIDHAQQVQMVGPSTLALAAGLAALEMDASVVESMRTFYLQQREALLSVLSPELLPYPPEGGLHALLDVSSTGLPDGDDFAAACCQEQRLRLLPGRLFGERAAHGVRLSLAARERPFGQALERLLQFIDGHRA